MPKVHMVVRQTQWSRQSEDWQQQMTCQPDKSWFTWEYVGWL